MKEYDVYSVAEINNLRTMAENARRLDLEAIPEGWSISSVDPMELLKVFDELRLKQGQVLYAYQFRLGGNGHGIVFVMSDNVDCPEPKIESDTTRLYREPQLPHGSTENIMALIEGDGTPRSYLLASIFAREVHEFGAMWHGNDWTTHTLLESTESLLIGGGNIPNMFQRPSTNPEEWEWIIPKLQDLRPKVYTNGGIFRVEFFTYSALGNQCLYQHVDTYKPGTYNFETVEKVIAKGPIGFVF